MPQHNAMLLRDTPSLYGSSHLLFCPLNPSTILLYVFFSDQIRDWTQVRLSSVLGAARLPAQRGEEAYQQREQGPGHRLQRLQAHLLRLRVSGERETSRTS